MILNGWRGANHTLDAKHHPPVSLSVPVDHEEIVTSRLRRYYRLSGAGAARLASEAEQIQRNAAVAVARLRRLRPEGEGGAL
jgi:hypothetical protein